MLADWLKEITKNKDAIQTITKSEDRIKRAYKELLSGYDQNPDEILNEVEKVENHKGTVEMKDIKYYSICGHHFLPFFGSVDIIYEPNKIITGLGKLPRLVEAYANRFQLQEFLVRDIGEQIMKSIEPNYIFVKATGRHLCMCSRGPKASETETITTYTLGEKTK